MKTETTNDVPEFALNEDSGLIEQINYTDSDVSDFYSAFLDINLARKVDSMNRIASDAYEKFILMGIPRREAESMSEGVRWIIEQQIKRA